MEVADALRARRTVRQYDPDYVIPKDVLNQLVELALDAPTGKNLQEIDLIVVTNRAKIDEISQITFNNLPPPVQKHFADRVSELGVKNVVTGDASALILLVSNERRDTQFLQIDAGIISMAIMAAAPNFGLGTMCLGCVVLPNGHAVEAAVGAPQGSLIVGIALGKPRDDLKLANKARLAKATII
jgi:nitroreductase